MIGLDNEYNIVCGILVADGTLEILFHEAMMRPQLWPKEMRWTIPLMSIDRTYWSYFGRSVNPYAGDDEGNPYLGIAF